MIDAEGKRVQWIHKTKAGWIREGFVFHSELFEFYNDTKQRKQEWHTRNDYLSAVIILEMYVENTALLAEIKVKGILDEVI